MAGSNAAPTSESGKPPTPPKRRFPLKRVITLVVFGMLAAALFYTTTEAFLARVRVFAVEAVDERTTGDFTIDHIGGSWLRRIEIEGIELKLSEATVARIETVAIEPVWRALLRRRFRLARIVVESPRLDLRIDAQGSSNLLRALASPNPEPTPESETADAGFSDSVALAYIEEIELENGSIRLETPDIEDFELISVDARLRVDSRANRFTLVSASAQTPDSRLEATGEIEPADSVRLQIDPIRIAGVDLARLGLANGGLESLAGRIEARGPWSEVSLSAALAAPAATAELEAVVDLARPDFSQTTLLAELTSTNLAQTLPESELAGRLQMSLESRGAKGRFELTLEPGQGRLDASGTFDWASARKIDAQLVLADFDPARLQPSRPQQSGRLSGRGAAVLEFPTDAGEDTGTKVDLDFSLAPSRVGNVAFDEAVLSVHGRDPIFEVESLRVRTRQGTASIAGRFDRRPEGPLDLRGAFDVTDIRPLAALADQQAEGRVDGRFELVGTTGAARLSGDLEAPRIELDIDSRSLALDGGRVDFDLRLDLTEPARVPRDSRLSARIEQFTIDREQGRLALDFHSSGTERPEFELALDLDLDLDRDGDRASIDASSRDGADADAGNAPSEAGTKAEVKVEAETDDGREGPVTAPIPQRLAFEVKGRLDGDRIDATIEAARLETSNGTWRLRDAARIQLEPDAVATDSLVLSDGRASLELKGRVARRGPQSFDLIARALPIAELAAALADDRDFETKGTLSVDAAIRGDARAPTISLDVESRDLSISDVRIERIATRLGVEDGIAQLEFSALRSRSLRFGAQARIPVELRWDGPFVARATGPLEARADCDQVELRLFEQFVKDSLTELAGKLECDLRLTGPLDALEPQGSLLLRNFAARPRATNVLIQNGSARLELDRTRIVLRDLSAEAKLGAPLPDPSTLALPAPISLPLFRAKVGGGDVTPGTLRIEGAWEHRGQIAVAFAGGQPDFEASGPIEGRLELERWPIIDTRAYKLVASGGVTAKGRIDAPELAGDVRLDEGVLRPTLEFLLDAPPARDPSIEFARVEGEPVTLDEARRKSEQAARERDALYQALALDVGFHVQRNLWIKHSEASLELRGDVQVRKRAGRTITLEGDIEAERGWARIQGRRFTLVDGQLDFAGQTPIDPFVDVLARYKVPSHTINARLEGRVSSPSLTLSSDPPLEQADILAVLLFGRPISELSEGEQVSVGQRATSLAAAYGMTAAGRSLANALGLEAAGIHIEELSQERAAVGTYIGQKTFVSLSQQFGVEQSQELRIEYEFWPDWSIVTSANSNGTNSLDLFWKIRY